MRTGISECNLSRKLIMPMTKHAYEKADSFEIHECQVAMEEIHDEEDPKDIIDKSAAHALCFGLHRRSEPLKI